MKKDARFGKLGKSYLVSVLGVHVIIILKSPPNGVLSLSKTLILDLTMS